LITEYSESYISSIPIAIAVFIAYFAYPVDIHYVLNNWQFIILIIIGYFVIGFIYSLFRWTLLCYKKIKYIKNNYEKLSKMYKDKPNFYGTFEQYLTYSGYIPHLYEYKYKIFHWVIYWPFNLINFIISDFIKYIFSNFFNIFKFLYSYILKQILNVFEVNLKNEM
jgi:uncharacterized integral membrane protein